eukprot:108605_1
MGRNGRCCSLRIRANHTIQNVIQLYCDQEGGSPQHMRLMMRGKMLQNHKTVAEYGIDTGSNLTIICRVSGGGSPNVQARKEEEKKRSVEDEITQAIQQIKLNPQSSRANIFRLAKQTYRQQQSPVVVDRTNALQDIKQNAAHYKNVALPLTLAIDKDIDTWNEQQFKRNFARKFNIPIECIHVLSVRAGSIIADLKLETHSSGNKLLIPIETLADNITNAKAKKALVEFGIFAMEFKEPTAGFNCLKQRVILNPQWNRAYGQGHTTWSGALNDGKSRGGEPYFCPSGWKRFAIQFSETAYDFAGKYDNYKWPIAYHGTKFDFSMMITLSGLKTTGGDHGVGVYMSPSIRYVSHPRYCRPHKLDLSQATQKEWSADQLKEFRKYDGKWIQCAFACRVKPGSFKKAKETMSYWTDFPSQNGQFDNIDVTTIEWLVGGNHGDIIGSDKILIYGVMIRASDKCQKGYEQ